MPSGLFSLFRDAVTPTYFHQKEDQPLFLKPEATHLKISFGFCVISFALFPASIKLRQTDGICDTFFFSSVMESIMRLMPRQIAFQCKHHFFQSPSIALEAIKWKLCLLKLYSIQIKKVELCVSHAFHSFQKCYTSPYKLFFPKVGSRPERIKNIYAGIAKKL